MWAQNRRQKGCKWSLQKENESVKGGFSEADSLSVGANYCELWDSLEMTSWDKWIKMFWLMKDEQKEQNACWGS